MGPKAERVVDLVDRGRRDFLRRLLTGAALAPPLIASFSPGGLSPAAAQTCPDPTVCVPNPPSVARCFTFANDQYQDFFFDMLRSNDISAGPDLAGHGRPALNFRGTAGAGGSTWLTVRDDEPEIGPCVSLTADVLSHRYNNSKGAGVLAFFNPVTTQRSVALVVVNTGNSDVLQLITVSATGARSTLASVSLRSGIREDAWYRLRMDAKRLGDTLEVTGRVDSHQVANNPDSALGPQVGGTPDLLRTRSRGCRRDRRRRPHGDGNRRRRRLEHHELRRQLVAGVSDAPETDGARRPIELVTPAFEPL